MKKLLLLLVLTLLPVVSYGQPNQDKFIKNEYIVVVKDDVNPESFSKTHRGQVKKILKHAFKGYLVNMDEEEAQKVANNPNVKFVEQNRIIEPSEATSLWNLDRIDQLAWPLDGQYNPQLTGQGVYAYVIDSGINFSHVDFEGRAIAGQDYVGDGQNGNDCFGHGSHVAGIVGSKTYGVAKQVTLVSMRIGACNGGAQIFAMAESIDWVIASGQRPAVINISYTAAGSSPTIDNSINAAYNNGVLAVVAAGNSNWDACAFTPAGVPNAFTISASGDNGGSDGAWLGANFGSCVDMFAPGIDILSTYAGSTTATRNMGGTSMAAPHVVGASALYLQQRPLDSPAVVKDFITANAIVNALPDSEGAPNLLLYSAFNIEQQVIPTCSTNSVRGYLKTGQTFYYPNVNGASGRNGLYTASVVVGQGVQYQLSLQKKQGQNWQTIASGTQIYSQQAKSGTFRYVLSGTSGDGGFALCYRFPQ